MAEELHPGQAARGHEVDLSPAMKRFLLLFNCILLAIGCCGGPQLIRIYFVHGGTRVWFSSWLETGGWPLVVVPLTGIYLHRRQRLIKTGTPQGLESQDTIISTNVQELQVKFFTMKMPLLICSTVIGVITGVDNYLYAYGVARLPVSTSSLIIASQLAFTAFFAFLLVKQKFTSYSINAIVLLVAGSAILGLNTNSDRPPGVTKAAYYAGFFVTLAAAALYGFILPVVELMYRKGRQVVTYGLVMEVQLVMCISATLFCTIGMIVNKDFQAIPREARGYGLGEVNYYVVVVWNAIIWQCYFLGAIGVIFCSSSLFSGVIVAVLLPFTEILAVLIFKEKFQAEKGVALALSLWGFVSYFYGELKSAKKMKERVILSDQRSRDADTELPQIVTG